MMMMMMIFFEFFIRFYVTAEATVAVTNVINYVDSSCDVMGEGVCVIRQKDTSLTFRNKKGRCGLILEMLWEKNEPAFGPFWGIWLRLISFVCVKGSTRFDKSAEIFSFCVLFSVVHETWVLWVQRLWENFRWD